MSSRSAPSSIRLLGPFEARRSEPDEVLPLRRKTRALLAYLAATGRPQPRLALAEMFCQDAKDPQRALRSILSRIRRQAGPESLLADRGSLQFNGEQCWIDAHQFERVLSADPWTREPGKLAAAVDLYRGAFLEDVTLSGSPEFELWLLSERARYQRLYERGLRALISGLVAEARFGPAIERAQQLAQSNSLLEAAHGQLMWLYAHTGQRDAALRQFEQCRQILERELAVEPTAELAALRAKIAAGEAGTFPGLAIKAPVVSEPRASPAAVSGEFVGRAAELARLERSWRTVSPPGSAVILLDAPTGMGKTRLVREFSASLGEALLLAGTCYESSRSLSYSPWIEMAETRLGQMDDGQLGALSHFAREHLGMLVPAIHRRLGLGPSPRRPPAPGELNQLFASIAEFLLELPGTPPQILFLDNLQWADEASLKLLHFIARRSPRSKLLLIGAVRADEIDEFPALQTLIDDLGRLSFHRLALSPLDLKAIDELAARLWPALPAGYRLHVCEMLAQATGGNPLFTREIIGELSHTAEVPASLPIPESARELIQRRLRMLPARGRQVLEAMSVLGGPTTAAEAQSTSGRSEEEVVDAIDGGLRRGLLRPPSESGSARYDFGHDLMREAVVSLLSGARRQLLHRRAAKTLEQAGSPPAVLARHWRMAGEPEREGHFSALAGAEAAATYDSEGAVRAFGRALELITETKRRTEVMVQLADVLEVIGEWDRAQATYEQALAQARQQGSRKLEASCLAGLGWLKHEQGDSEGALAHLQEARELYTALDDAAGLSDVLGGIGLANMRQGHNEVALASFVEKLRLAQRMGDALGTSKAYSYIGIFHAQLDDHEQGLGHFRDALRLAQEYGDRLHIGTVLGNVASVYQMMKDFRQALDYRQQELDVCLAIGDRSGLSIAVGNMGALYLDLGYFGRAMTCFGYQLKLCLELGDRWSICAAIGHIARTHALQGEGDPAERRFSQAVMLARQLSIPFDLCQLLYQQAEHNADRGRHEVAQRLNEEALTLARQVGRKSVEFPAQVMAIRLRFALGELDVTAAEDALRALSELWKESHELAAVAYETWRLRPGDPGLQRHGDRAADRYRAMYGQHPLHEYRLRYRQITGRPLPQPPPFPELPDFVAGEQIDVNRLFGQVAELLASLLEQSDN